MTTWFNGSRVSRLSCGFLALSLLALPALAQKISVTSADPMTGEQGSVGLNIRIYGRGFAPGATSTFTVTGTVNTGGVVVLSTSYVSSTELLAVVDIADDARLDYYDIEVLNRDGRTGKGLEKFAVTVKGGGIACSVPPQDPRFELVAALNSNVTGDQMFGLQTRVRSMWLNGRNVLVLAVGTVQSELEIFVLDAASGAALNLDGTTTLTAPPSLRLPFSVVSDAGLRDSVIGDIDGNGVPDILVGNRTDNNAVLFLGALAGGSLSYSTGIRLQDYLPGVTLRRFGSSVALGNLDAFAGDEVVVGDDGGGTGKSLQAGKVYIFKLVNGTPQLWRTLSSPLPNPKNDDLFGSSADVGDTNGDGHADLVVGAQNAIVSGKLRTGRVYTFTALHSGSTSQYTSIAGTAADDNYGAKVAIAKLLQSPPNSILAATAWTGNYTRVDAWTGSVLSNTFTPSEGYEGGWNTNRMGIGDIDGDGLDDVIVGAPNAPNNLYQCPSPGAVNLYLSTDGYARVTLQAPVMEADFGGFGWSVDAVGGTPFFIIGETGRNVGGTVNSGQVYIYRIRALPTAP